MSKHELCSVQFDRVLAIDTAVVAPFITFYCTYPILICFSNSSKAEIGVDIFNLSPAGG